MKKHYGYITGGSHRKRLTLCGVWLYYYSKCSIMSDCFLPFVKSVKQVTCKNCKKTRIFQRLK